ncbi:MAG: hypothetical protein U5K81_13190 [Trueperaceae bacterium]|nr:hypothetical protein [Trueperaceae bacterium]
MRFAAALLAVPALAFALGIAGHAVAQDAPTARVEVAEHSALGEHLVDGDGRTLYLFADTDLLDDETETVREGVRDASPRCDTSCTSAWPQLRSGDDPRAGPGVEEDLLYAAGEGMARQAVYNGWPLYRFAGDAEAGDALGQGIAPPDRQAFGGTWYAVAPNGTPIEASLPADDAGGEDEGAGEREGEDDDENEDGGGGYY